MGRGGFHGWPLDHKVFDYEGESDYDKMMVVLFTGRVLFGWSINTPMICAGFMQIIEPWEAQDNSIYERVYRENRENDEPAEV